MVLRFVQELVVLAGFMNHLTNIQLFREMGAGPRSPTGKPGGAGATLPVQLIDRVEAF